MPAQGAQVDLAAVVGECGTLAQRVAGPNRDDVRATPGLPIFDISPAFPAATTTMEPRTTAASIADCKISAHGGMSIVAAGVGFAGASGSCL